MVIGQRHGHLSKTSGLKIRWIRMLVMDAIWKTSMITSRSQTPKMPEHRDKYGNDVDFIWSTDLSPDISRSRPGERVK